jgi:hypothetical protein
MRLISFADRLQHSHLESRELGLVSLAMSQPFHHEGVFDPCQSNSGVSSSIQVVTCTRFGLTANETWWLFDSAA